MPRLFLGGNFCKWNYQISMPGFVKLIPSMKSFECYIKKFLPTAQHPND